MNTQLVNSAADLIARTVQTRQTAAGIAMALDAACMLQSPDTTSRMIRAEQRRAELEAVLSTHRNDDLAEIGRLRARVAELEQQAANARALHIRYPASEHCQHDGEQWPCPTVSALGAVDPASLWQRVTDALNALVAAGVPVHVEPDGHISNPAADEHIEWDRAAGRWQLVHDDEPPLTAEQAEARRLGYRARMRAAGGDIP